MLSHTNPHLSGWDSFVKCIGFQLRCLPLSILTSDIKFETVDSEGVCKESVKFNETDVLAERNKKLTALTQKFAHTQFFKALEHQQYPAPFESTLSEASPEKPDKRESAKECKKVQLEVSAGGSRLDQT